MSYRSESTPLKIPVAVSTVERLKAERGIISDGVKSNDTIISP
jgi:hypothetical protein